MSSTITFIPDTSNQMGLFSSHNSMGNEPLVGLNAKTMAVMFEEDSPQEKLIIIADKVFRAITLKIQDNEALLSLNEYQRFIESPQKTYQVLKNSDLEATWAEAHVSLLDSNTPAFFKSSYDFKNKILKLFKSLRTNHPYMVTYQNRELKVTFKDVKNSCLHQAVKHIAFISEETKFRLRKGPSTPIYFENKLINFTDKPYEGVNSEIFEFTVCPLRNDLPTTTLLEVDLLKSLSERLKLKDHHTVSLFLASDFSLTINNTDYIVKLHAITAKTKVYSEKSLSTEHINCFRYGMITDKTEICFTSDPSKIKITPKPPSLIPFVQVKPRLSFNDFINSKGLVGLPTQIGKAIDLIADSLDPLKAEKMQKYMIKRKKGVLLHGKPGTGKTSITHLIKKFLEIPEGNYTSLCMSKVLGKYVGETEGNIRGLFENAKKNPRSFYLLVLDELDSIGDRERTDIIHQSTPINQLLTLMDGEKIDNIVVIGLTNHLHKLDKALLRPGRFDAVIEIPLPDAKQRAQIFEHYLKPLRNNELVDKDVDVAKLAEKTEGGSGADIEGIVNEAKECAYQKDSLITKDILFEALRNSHSLTFKRKRDDNEDLTYFT